MAKRLEKTALPWSSLVALLIGTARTDNFAADFGQQVV